MSNSHEYCGLETTDPEDVGVGLGSTPEGDRICVSLTGTKINPHLAEDRLAESWVSLTPDCAKELYALLATVKHIWEEQMPETIVPEVDPETKTGLNRNKFQIRRTDGGSAKGGRHADCDFFVLDLQHDKFAKPALTAYAAACADEYPFLAKDIRDKLLKEE